MAAKIYSITAVLVATAFALATSCETGTCDESGPPTEVEVEVTVIQFVVYLNYPPTKVCEWAKACEAPEFQPLIALFEAWEENPETNREALEVALLAYYKTNPTLYEIDFTAVFEVCASGTPPDNSDCEVPPQYCPGKKDVFNWMESCCSHEPVQDFFDGKGMELVGAAYKAWKEDRGDGKLEVAYQAALYTWYQENPTLLESDCPEFVEACKAFCTNPKCEVCAAGKPPSVNPIPPQVTSEPPLPVNPTGY